MAHDTEGSVCRDAHRRRACAVCAGGWRSLAAFTAVRELWCGPIGRRRASPAWRLPSRSCRVADRSRKRLAPGEIGAVAVIAASREQAGTVFNYIRGFLMASPLLAGQVESIGRDEIMLRGDICISVVTNSFRVARGMTLLAVHRRRGLVLA